MRVSVFGLGYVGTVTAACLAKNGYSVTGVDIKPAKAEQVNEGLSPIEEPGIDTLVENGVETRRLSATTDAALAIDRSEMSFICVGTPVDETGGVDLSRIENVADKLGSTLADQEDYHTVVLRSTVPPGTTRVVEDSLAEESGVVPGEDFGIVMNPEFMREGSAIDDFHDPPFVVLGSTDDRATSNVLDVYETIGVTPSEIFPVEPEAAELVKYASNSFHAAKVAFANEIGRVAKNFGVDGREVMEIFCQDRKLNISSYYLEPGFSFGGSCLTKDTRALVEFSERSLPFIESILPANRTHTERAMEAIEDFHPDTVGIAGLSFKPATDDMRSSPAVHLARRLLDEGYDVCVFDPNVDEEELIGANREFVEDTLPELYDIRVDTVEALVARSDVVVVGNASPEFRRLRHDDVAVFDPVGLFDLPQPDDEHYGSLCW